MNTAEYEFIKERIAPCGLHCGRCFTFMDGDIREHSAQLKAALGNFGVYAERFGQMLDDNIYASYPEFKKFLDHLATGSCGGCRKENCKGFTTCGVRPCATEKKVDFCFQCAEFPCGKTGFDEHLYARHVKINQKMKDIGVKEYYDYIKDKPRY